MKVVIAADQAGYPYKAPIRRLLAERGHQVTDFGTSSDAPIDYPTVIRRLAQEVAQGTFERGVLIGGSGNDEAIMANRVRGVRCAVCWNVSSAQFARAHCDANMLAIGQRMMPPEEALAIVEAWIKTPFEGGRHLRRWRLVDEE